MPYEDTLLALSDYLKISTTAALIILAVISIWTIIWKGLALWKSSQKKHVIWFIVFLLVNTMGILEILYLYIFSKMSLKKKGGGEKPKPKSKKKKVVKKKK